MSERLIIAGPQRMETMIISAILSIELGRKSTSVLYVINNKSNMLLNILRNISTAKTEVDLYLLGFKPDTRIIRFLPSIMGTKTTTSTKVSIYLHSLLKQYPRYRKLSNSIINNREEMANIYLYGSYDTQVKSKYFIKDFKDSIISKTDTMNITYTKDCDNYLDKNNILKYVKLTIKNRLKDEVVLINESRPNDDIESKISSEFKSKILRS